jgi:hypothetical protein
MQDFKPDNNAEVRAALVLLIADLRDAIDVATAGGGDDAVLDVALPLEQASALYAALVDYLAKLRHDADE